MKNKGTYDVVVIGGGVCGAAIAWQLAKTKIKTALVEKEGICSGASATNPGFCVLTYRGDPLQLDMAREQMTNMPALAGELGVDLELSVSGGLIPISNQQELDILSGLVDNCHKNGLREVEIVKPCRAVEQEPALDPQKIIGAVYCPEEGLINPFRLTIGFASKAEEYGADIFTQTEVTELETTAGRISAVVTTRGAIKTDFVILAAGAWTKEIVNMVGVDLPVFYERGEAMISMTVPRIIRGMVTDGGLFVKPQNKPEMVVGACLSQTASGNVAMAQATTDVDNYNCRSTYNGPKMVAGRVLAYFPLLKDLEVIRVWAGVVAYTNDYIPVFGFLEKPDNLLITVAFHSSISIAGAIGNLALKAYERGGLSPELMAYSPQRFV
jgi:sarcosine oxidase subunit beta